MLAWGSPQFSRRWVVIKMMRPFSGTSGTSPGCSAMCITASMPVLPVTKMRSFGTPSRRRLSADQDVGA
jgi:hypothetical protein